MYNSKYDVCERKTRTSFRGASSQQLQTLVFHKYISLHFIPVLVHAWWKRVEKYEL